MTKSYSVGSSGENNQKINAGRLNSNQTSFHERTAGNEIIYLNELLNEPTNQEKMCVFFEKINQMSEPALARLKISYRTSEIEQVIQNYFSLDQNLNAQEIIKIFGIFQKLSESQAIDGALSVHFFSILTIKLVNSSPTHHDIAAIFKLMHWFERENIDFNPLLEKFLDLTYNRNNERHWYHRGQEDLEALTHIMLDLAQLVEIDPSITPISVSLFVRLMQLSEGRDTTTWGISTKYFNHASHDQAVLFCLNQLITANRLNGPIPADSFTSYSCGFEEIIPFLTTVNSITQSNQIEGKFSKAFCADMARLAFHDYRNTPDKICLLISWYAKLVNAHQLANDWKLSIFSLAHGLDCLLESKSFIRASSSDEKINNLIVGLADLIKDERLLLLDLKEGFNLLEIVQLFIYKLEHIYSWPANRLQQLETRLASTQDPDNLLLKGVSRALENSDLSRLTIFKPQDKKLESNPAFRDLLIDPWQGRA